ncbi:GntR family transcriptional regulator [Ureaplasma canigenitalium]|uniref:GntR family transcriptional regulator n=1 Tax=Ureaplasma canigenitalium TaxID=42092 RepID=UPI00068D8A30|nr:GntR family transcriptional regulator [Ureaplasma canigenitalium]
MTNKAYILRYVLLKIAVEEFKIKDIIPSEHKLADKFSIGRITVHNAYEILKVLGIISPIQGSGFYVTKTIDEYINPIFARLYHFTDRIRYEQFAINYLIEDRRFSHALRVSLYDKQKNLMGMSYFFLNRFIESDRLSDVHINMAKILLDCGIDDFFNVETTISFQNREIYGNMLPLGQIKEDVPVVVIKLYNTENKLQAIIVTHLTKKYLLIEEHKKFNNI